MRPIVVLAPLILLNACALPAAFSVATLAVDGISYATSGKSVADHALSVVANEDCAMWRALQERPICRVADMPETMVASAPGVAAAPAPKKSPEEPPEASPEELATVLAVAPAAGSPRAPETAKAETPARLPKLYGGQAAIAMPGEFEATAAAFFAVPATGASRAPDFATAEIPAEMPILTASLEMMPTPTANSAAKPELLATTTETPTTPAATTETPATPIAATETPTTPAAKPVRLATLAVPLPSMQAKPKFGRFVILGSYLKEANARDAMKRGDDFQPRMVRVRVRGKLYHRVVSGPYARGAIATMRRTLIGEGFPDAWTAKLCENTLRLAPCPTAPLPLNLTAN